MFSIGILGFIVWSYSGPLHSDMEINHFHVCWNSNSTSTIISYNLVSTLTSAGIMLSSTTALKASFDFTKFYQHHKFIDPTWLQWFIGFAEGDGGWYTRANGRMTFVLTQYEQAILLHIRDVLGFGVVRFGKGVNAYRYIVEDISSITLLAYLFNGNLVLQHRISQFSSWMTVLASRGIDIVFSATPAIFTLSDGWLSGFTDAEGSFTTIMKVRASYKLGYQVLIRFILDQKNEAVLTIVMTLFNTGSVSLRKGTNGVYRYDATNNIALGPVVNYFTQFPLRTIKADAFIKWCKVRELVLAKNHLTPEGLAEIKQLVKVINDKSSIKR